MWALLAPLVEPVLRIFGQLFGTWVAYKGGKDSQRAAAAENAMDQSRKMRDVAETRADVPVDERRERLREHFKKRPG